MPNIDKECEGKGATHHHACKCREVHFAELEKRAREMAELYLKYLEYIHERICPTMDRCICEMQVATRFRGWMKEGK